MLLTTLTWLTYQLVNLTPSLVREERQFRRFLEEYNKSYALRSTEYWHRFSIFKESLERINQLNSQRSHPKSAYYGLTPFADLTHEEFRVKVLNRPFHDRSFEAGSDEKGARLLFSSSGVLHEGDRLFDALVGHGGDDTFPLSVDWRKRGVIGNVIAQGKCGSCWAHTLVDTIASMVTLSRPSGDYVKLSAQQLLDCSANNFGCDGGDLCAALSWLVGNNVSLLTDHQYPLRLDSGPCRSPRPTNGVRIHSNYTCHSEIGSEDNMINLLAHHGPLMAAADASTWQYYINGTIHKDCGKQANHAVQIVGYNLKDEIPYYIVRNTWGTDWGIDGYLQIAIGNNTCDVGSEVAAVWIKSTE